MVHVGSVTYHITTGDEIHIRSVGLSDPMKRQVIDYLQSELDE